MNHLKDAFKEKEILTIRELKAFLLLGSTDFDNLIKEALTNGILEVATQDYDEVGNLIPTAYKFLEK